MLSTELAPFTMGFQQDVPFLTFQEVLLSYCQCQVRFPIPHQLVLMLPESKTQSMAMSHELLLHITKLSEKITNHEKNYLFNHVCDNQWIFEDMLSNSSVEIDPYEENKI